MEKTREIQRRPERELIVSVSAKAHVDTALIASWLFQKGPKTQIYYRRVVRNFFHFFPQLSLATTEITHLVLFLKTFAEFSDSTRNTYKNALSSLFGFAFKTGYITKNPAAALENLKVPDRLSSKVLSREQMEQMMAREQNPRNKLILKLLYFTGIRVAELCQIKKDSFYNHKDANAESWTLVVEGKGRKVRSIHLPQHLAMDLQKWMTNLDSSDYIFTNERRLDFGIGDYKRDALSPSQVFRIVKQSAKSAKLSVAPSPHWLRHTSATHAIEAGAPIHVVQKSLGHDSISTTGKYLDIRPKESVGDYLEELD
jgi:integrase/recombinase XerD